MNLDLSLRLNFEDPRSTAVAVPCAIERGKQNNTGKIVSHHMGKKVAR